MKFYRQLFIGAFVLFLVLFAFGIPSSQSARKHRGDGIISLYNAHLGEIVEVQYRKKHGRYNKQAVKQIEHTLRCRYTHETHKIHLELLELVDAIQDHFNADTVYVVSAYRSPELNHSLWRSGRKVTYNSPHMYGQAMDIRIPGVPLSDIRDYAYQLDMGGVGYYSSKQFLHVDVGVKKHW